MEALKQRILDEAIVAEGDVLRVDSFLNHQVDLGLMSQMADCFCEHFQPAGVTRVLTIEASGIAIAAFTALRLGVPLVFAKKTESSNVGQEAYEAQVYSYTREREYTIRVDQKYIRPTDRVLIIDDFLAIGSAATGLIQLVEQAGATLVGVGIVIEKGFQPGGRVLREKGIDVYSLAIIEEFRDGTVVLR